MAKRKTLTLLTGKLAAERLAEWLDLANGTANLAGSEAVRERALAWVRDAVQSHLSSARTKHEASRQVLKAIKQGRLQIRLPAGVVVHVPELRRAIYSLVPRMVEAVIGSPSFFDVVAGRETKDEPRAKALREWSRYQIDHSQLAARLPAAAFSLIVHGYAMLASSYRFETRKVRRRIASEGTNDDGVPNVTYRIEESEEIVSEGLDVEHVDPFDAILDWSVSDPDEMRWIGRRRFIAEPEARAMIVNSEWLESAVDEAIEKRSNANQRIPGFGGMGLNSAPATAEASKPTIEGEQIAGLHEMVEMWGLFSPDGKSRPVECQVVVLNNTVVLVRENAHWDGHRGLSMVALNDDGTELVSESSALLGTTLNAELDQLRAASLRAAMSAAAPFGLTRGQNLTLPQSLWDVPPGRIFNAGADPTASFEALRMPSAVGDVQVMERQIRTDIEDLMGAPRFWTGADTSGTATEIERRNEEARRQLLGKAERLETLVRKVLENSFALSKQYTTRAKPFPVLGPRAGEITWGEITPEDFNDPVDFIMLGTATIDVYGMRATKIMSAIQAVTPTLLALYQTGEVKPRAVAKLILDEMAGEHLTAQILPPDQADLAMDPEDENELLASGTPTSVYDIDDHEEHEATHAPLMRHPLPGVRRVTAEHLAMHRLRRVALAARQRQSAAAVVPPETDGRLRPQEGRSGRSGAPYTRPPDMRSESDQGSAPGQLNGPPAAARMAAPDRVPAVPQGANLR